MLRQAAWHDEDRVDSDVVAGAGVTRLELARGDRDAAQSMLIERKRRGVGGGALFDLDEGEHLAAPGNKVDFAAAHLDPLGENSPAVEAEPPGRDRLGAASALFGVAAVQPDAPIANARA